jgi:hypothetical protein
MVSNDALAIPLTNRTAPRRVHNYLSAYGALPWTRWGRGPQTPISAARLFLTSRPFPPTILDEWGLGPPAPAGPGQSPGLSNLNLALMGQSPLAFSPGPC